MKKELSSDRDTAYIVELSNDTKFLCFMRGYFGTARHDTVQIEERRALPFYDSNFLISKTNEKDK